MTDPSDSSCESQQPSPRPWPKTAPANESMASKSEIVQAGSEMANGFRSSVSWCFSSTRRFLEIKNPSVIFMISFALLICSALVERLSFEFVPDTEQVRQVGSNGLPFTSSNTNGSYELVHFISSCAYYIQIAAAMLAVWALFRLIADAIKEGSKS